MAVVNVNKENFETEVLKCDKKVLVDFNASWCGPCRMLKPIVEEISEENKDLKVVSIDVDSESELAEKYGVFSIPCLVVFDNGEEVKRNVGLISKDEIESIIGDK